MMQAYLSWNKEVTANVKVCEDTLTPQPEMRRPAPATKARASHCQNAKPYQMISRSLVTCTAQINNIHVVIKPAHCALCSLTFLIFFHFWYCGIEESSRGSSCPHPILHPQQTELSFWQSMHPGTHQSHVIKSEMGLLAAWVWTLMFKHVKSRCANTVFWLWRTCTHQCARAILSQVQGKAYCGI